MDVSWNIPIQPTKDQAMQANKLKLRVNQNSKELSQHMQVQEAVIMWIPSGRQKGSCENALCTDYF